LVGYQIFKQLFHLYYAFVYRSVVSVSSSFNVFYVFFFLDTI